MMQTIYDDLPHSLKRNPLLSCNVFLRHVVEKMQLYKFLLPVAQTINSFMARFRNVLLIICECFARRSIVNKRPYT